MSLMSRRTGRPPPALPRHLGLGPPARQLRRLAVVHTRAFGWYGRDPVRVTGAAAAHFERQWRWRVWVTLACVTSLLDLIGNWSAGWLASVSPHALLVVRPVRPSLLERTRYWATAGGAGLVLLTPAVVALVAPFAFMSVIFGASWPLWVGWGLLVLLLAPMVLDLTGRRLSPLGRSARSGLPGAAFYGSNLCAHPQRLGHGEALLARLIAGMHDIGPVHLVIQAWTPALADLYAREAFGFCRVDGDGSAARPVMTRSFL